MYLFYSLSLTSAYVDGIASNSLGGGRGGSKLEEDNSFDLLLKEAQAKLRKRKV